mmetsp:Transcript_12697/g.19006  ORF Transcript_12697/g.19006 Transcript_12697/m.19006 type:complete len:117 (+) Transcript_12697:1020-1370(+)
MRIVKFVDSNVKNSFITSFGLTTTLLSRVPIAMILFILIVLENKAEKAISNPSVDNQRETIHVASLPSSLRLNDVKLSEISARVKINVPAHNKYRKMGCAARTAWVFRLLYVHTAQ